MTEQTGETITESGSPEAQAATTATVEQTAPEAAQSPDATKAETQPKQEQQQSQERKSLLDDATDGDAEATEGTEEAAKAEIEPYTLKAPEGASYDSEVLSTFADRARELGISQEQAQQILEAVGPKMAERQQAQLAKAADDWYSQVEKDADLGGTKLPETRKQIAAAIKAYGDPEVEGLLRTTGLANHPAVARLLAKAGRAISEDRVTKGSPLGQAAMSPFERLAAANARKG